MNKKDLCPKKKKSLRKKKKKKRITNDSSIKENGKNVPKIMLALKECKA